MVCEKCGAPTRMQVQATISAPGELFHKLSKQNMRSKDVYLMGVNWETADFICCDCGTVRDGYGNYVTSLRTTNAEQAERIKQLERALDDQMVSTHLGVFGPKDDPIMAIHKLMCWSQDVGAFFAKDRIAQLEDALRESHKFIDLAAWREKHGCTEAPELYEDVLAMINEVLKENSNDDWDRDSSRTRI